MTLTRNNHYVPRWYQEGFFEIGKRTYSYLDINPNKITLHNGDIVFEKSKFNSPSSRAFCQIDLYSTFFGEIVNDEIERKLFGDLDCRGAAAVRAFVSDDSKEWQQHFTSFFEYLDIQKLRTPKGLDWLSAQYPRLTQNELMFEMQGIRMMHCTIWTEGVREIISAQDAETKFIVSDHPVTTYNYAMPPGMKGNIYPNDPSIALKGTQTIFPLNRDFCLILTNLEYAKDHSTEPLKKRTFAGNYRNSLVRTDSFIRTRKLTSEEVVRVNRVIKSGAKRYIAAGKEEWLYPEIKSAEPWPDLRMLFVPPSDGILFMGGDMFVRLQNNDVYFQDSFGRTEHERDFLKKAPLSTPPRARDLCGCGSGRRFGNCCNLKSVALRPTWKELSIRERNLMLFTGISNILGINDVRDWVTIRKEINDDKIKDVYSLYDALWPRETNFLEMLPKPDGVARAIYTGVIHPQAISNCALGLSFYFDELLLEHPFIHPGAVKKEFSPTENPHMYRQEFLKSVFLFMMIMPFIEQGLITLFPDPCNFDLHLRHQVMNMANRRSNYVKYAKVEDDEFIKLMEDEYKRSILLQPRDALRRKLLQFSPDLDAKYIDLVLNHLDLLRENDPLAVLTSGSLEEGGQFIPFKMVPNFEITMYLAQATGSCIVTDSIFRWNELKAASRRQVQSLSPLAHLKYCIEKENFIVPCNFNELDKLGQHGALGIYPNFMKHVYKYLSAFSTRGLKPNVESSLVAEFRRAHTLSLAATKKSRMPITTASISCLWPSGGIQDNAVSRLLLMSSSEHHLASAPMALFVKRQ